MLFSRKIGSCIYLLLPQGRDHVSAIEANVRKDRQFRYLFFCLADTAVGCNYHSYVTLITRTTPGLYA